MKIEKELKISKLMIEIYCKKRHKEKKLCAECNELYEYVCLRLSKCPFQDNKTFCSNCKIHCYNPEKRQKIKAVMKYSGPRMIFHHPILAVNHLIENKKENKNDKK